MANTETWVGLDTNATAGRNEAIADESGVECFNRLKTHDVLAGIVAENLNVSEG